MACRPKNTKKVAVLEEDFSVKIRPGLLNGTYRDFPILHVFTKNLHLRFVSELSVGVPCGEEDSVEGSLLLADTGWCLALGVGVERREWLGL